MQSWRKGNTKNKTNETVWSETWLECAVRIKVSYFVSICFCLLTISSQLVVFTSTFIKWGSRHHLPLCMPHLIASLDLSFGVIYTLVVWFIRCLKVVNICPHRCTIREENHKYSQSDNLDFIILQKIAAQVSKDQLSNNCWLSPFVPGGIKINIFQGVILKF